MPETDSGRSPSGPGVAGLLLAAAAPVAGAALIIRRKGAGWPGRSLLLLAAVGLSITVAGCFALDIFGTVNGKVRFEELIYEGGQDTVVWGSESMEDAKPLWRLDGGTGTYDVDMSTVSVIVGEDGEEEKTVMRCTGTVVYEVEGAIFTDLEIPADAGS
jgi:hypothetical protein